MLIIYIVHDLLAELKGSRIEAFAVGNVLVKILRGEPSPVEYKLSFSDVYFRFMRFKGDKTIFFLPDICYRVTPVHI